MNTHPTTLSFILVDSKRHAQMMLDNAEQIDFYLNICQMDPINAKARRYQQYVANSISPDEYEYYQKRLSQLIPSIPQRLRMDLDVIHIVPLMLTADGGLPHTRPHSLICVSHLQQLTSSTTVIHELWHIHQRKYNDLWKKVFAALEWTEWPGQLPSFLEHNRRSNPDTIDSPLWVYQHTWVPVPIFRDITLPDLTEVDIWFYHVRDNYHLKQVPNVLKNMFPNVPHSSYEHPRELSAYILSEHEKHVDSPALATLVSSIGRLAIIS